MNFTDKAIDLVMELMNQGRLSPMPKPPSQDDPLQMVTLPDEKIKWFGKLDADIEMFGRTGIGSSSKYTTFDVLVGASPFRLVFFHERGLIKSKFMSRSYWFDVDLEDMIWRHKKGLRRKEYTSLQLAPPAYKKSFMSREIIITNIATRADGKQVNTFECTLSSLKWFNPQTRKFEQGKADQLHQQIMEFYNQRQPVTFLTLWLLVDDPDKMLEDVFFATEPAEGQAIQVTEAAPPRPGTKPAEGQAIQVDAPVEKLQPARKPAKRPVSAAAAKTCSACGKAIKPSAKFCGGCGATVGEEAPTSVAKPRSKTIQASTPSAAVCPSCGKIIKPGASYCGDCGARFNAVPESLPKKTQKKAGPPTCPECKKLIKPAWKACPYCGRPLSASPD